MANIEEDKEREERILMEVVVDAYDKEERIMGWYYYIAEGLSFPFKAKCITIRRSSPLVEGEKVEVTEMSPADDCENDMLVDIQWQGRTLAVPLSQLEGIDIDDEDRKIIEDWHYWVNRGYEF